MNMKKAWCLIGMVGIVSVAVATAAQPPTPPAEKKFEEDTIKADGNDLKITFIGHGTLMFTYQSKIIHVDPWTNLADYSKLPKADVILITHEHPDHLDAKAVAAIRKDQTVILLTKSCADKITGGIVMKNGDTQTVAGVKIEAVPAYNLDNKTFHPKGNGNGYVITFGKTRVYVAGDTENIPEMKDLKSITIAFLPMNLPYTMTPEQVAQAAQTLHPKILYPYHFGQTDTNMPGVLLKDTDIEVRIRKMQ
jgi:L-ascorbate metabolism protein UlaG (beta-lactamase superfamily)